MTCVIAFFLPATLAHMLVAKVVEIKARNATLADMITPQVAQAHYESPEQHYPT